MLLNRAVRIKQQQDRVLPLFLMVCKGGYPCVDPAKLHHNLDICAKSELSERGSGKTGTEDLPSECPLNLMLLALIALSNGTFEQKFKLFLQMYYRETDCGRSLAEARALNIVAMHRLEFKQLTFNLRFLQSMVVNFHHVLHRIGFLPFPPYLEEIENSCYRAVMPFCQCSEPPAAAHMTMFEFRGVIHQFCGLYYPIMRVLGLENDKTNRFSSYQRNVMSPLVLLSKGLMGPYTARLKYHIDTSRYRGLLDPSHKSDMHERAFAMGENDPLMPDYSSFMKKAGQKGVTNVVALDHGHLHNVGEVTKRHKFRAANRIQARARAIIDRKYAAIEARMQAYLEAKDMALKEMRKRILLEFKKRDEYKDAARLKWDAQVRMRQAKLKSTGTKADRSETIMVMIDEAISRAAEDIDAKFRKIEQDQNFPAGSLAPIDAATQVAIDKGLRVGKRKAAPSHEDLQQPEKISRTGDIKFDGKGANSATMKLAEVKGKLMTIFKKDDGIGGVEDLDGSELMRRPEIEEQGKGEAAIGEGEQIDGVAETAVTMIPASSMTEDTMIAMIEGRYFRNPRGDGPILEEQENERMLALAEPYHPKQFYERILAIDSAFSDLRLNELLSELPSKRMVMQYVDHTSLMNLVHDLSNHFCIPRNVEKIACVFKNYVASDFERGFLNHSIKQQHIFHENALRMFAYGQVHTHMLAMNAAVKRKLIADPLLTEEVILKAEENRLDGILSRHKLALDNIIASIDRLKVKFKKALLNSQESCMRKHSIELLLEDNVKMQEQARLKGIALGICTADREDNNDVENPEVLALNELRQRSAPIAALAGLPPAIVTQSKQLMEGLVYLSEHAARNMGSTKRYNVDYQQRFNWTRRLSAALAVRERTPDGKDAEQALLGGIVVKAGVEAFEPIDSLEGERAPSQVHPVHNIEEMKFLELKSICTAFMENVKADASVIITELYLPSYLKTIPVTHTEKVDGRGGSECGRGFEGGYIHVFEAHNIVYRVCLDYNGICNGSDENAAKMGGHERLGAMYFCRFPIPRLHVPLVTTVDLFGYRVVAVSKLPCEINVFNDDIELRKSSSDLVHGMSKGGSNFINRSKPLQKLLRGLALSLNTSEHFAKGVRDMSGTSTVMSAELNVYRVTEDEDQHFYCNNFWRTFPGEDPQVTWYLSRSPRDQSVFWRQLRPEFVKSYRIPLSPDACCAASFRVKDQFERAAEVEEATRYLVDVVIPNTADKLVRYAEVTSASYPLSEGLGLNLSNFFHDHGINMRHLGYMRHLLWRKLAGSVSVYFNEQWLHTSHDLREDLYPGYIVNVGGDHVFTIDKFEGKRKPSARRLPIVEKHKGLSLVKLVCHTGHSLNADLTPEKELLHHNVRCTLLSEMVARTVKSLIRYKLREYSKSFCGTSSDIVRTALCTYLNALTGAAANSVELLNHEVFEYLRQKFGLIAIKGVEREHLHHTIRPCLSYIVKRIQSMMGVTLSSSAIGDFFEAPVGFMFIAMDIVDVFPRLKHSVGMVDYADAVLADCAASRLEKSSYTHEVLKDRPVAYLRCSDRKGSRALENKGSLGTKLRAMYANDVQLEEPGPLLGDPFNRSARFIADLKTRVDTKYSNVISPTDASAHFSVEMFLRCMPMYSHEKGQLVETAMVAAQCGRWCINVTRERMWVFVLQDGIHDVSIDLGPMKFEVWSHVVCTYDGVYVRGYVDSIMVCCVNAKDAMARRMASYEADFAQKRQNLLDGEVKEKEQLKTKTMQQAAEYFQSKAGIANIKTLAGKIMDSLEFKEERFGEAEAADDQAAQKAKKAEAISRAKKKYITELYIRTVRDVTEEYQTMNLELEYKMQKERENNEAFARRPLRLGAASAAGSATEGQKFFNGGISCVSIYQTVLSADRVVVHFMAANADRSKEARRLFGIASAGYEKALLITPNDPMILRKYSSSLCGYLHVEVMKPPPAPSAEMLAAGVVIAAATANAGGLAKAKEKLTNVVSIFKERFMLDGIADIMLRLPEESEFSSLMCHCFNSIADVSKNYFATSDVITRKDLVMIPKRFGLDLMDNEPYYINTAAAIFREVMRDPVLFDAYGDVKLGWLKDIKSAELVVAIIQQTVEDPSLLVLKVGELFKTGVLGKYRDITIVDRDVEVLAEALPLLSVFDLSGCTRLTSQALSLLSMSKYLRVINLDRCTGVFDDGIALLAELYEHLEGISLVGLTQISDRGLLPVARACKGMSFINLNNCCNISDITIETFAKNSRQLQTFHVSACLITEECFNNLAGLLPAKNLTSLDISLCREATDNAITAIVSRCANLNYLNLTGLTRLTGQTVRTACSNLWSLKHLNIEDVFLIDDKAFWFDIKFDSRQAAGENMLRDLATLNLADCSHLTDKSIEGLAMRCRKLEKLIVKGCDKLTDKSLQFMISKEDQFKFPFCDQLRHLDLSFCRRLTARGLASLLPQCMTLEELVLTGLPFINDEVVTNMCRVCPTLLRLTFEKCALITDVSICAIAKNLWIERYFLCEIGTFRI